MDVGSVINQHPDTVNISIESGQMKRRLPMIIPIIHIDAVGEELKQALCVSLLCCKTELLTCDITSTYVLLAISIPVFSVRFVILVRFLR